MLLVGAFRGQGQGVGFSGWGLGLVCLGQGVGFVDVQGPMNLTATVIRRFRCSYVSMALLVLSRE